VLDAAWATATGAEIDRIAARYQRIQDRVRLPAVAGWLRKGAARLAQLHRRVAELLDGSGQIDAANAELAKARALSAGSAPNPPVPLDR
jgi:hypothetical protein